MANKIICPKCDGIGVVHSLFGDWRPCPRCKGEGEIDGSKAVQFSDPPQGWSWAKDVAGD